MTAYFFKFVPLLRKVMRFFLFTSPFIELALKFSILLKRFSCSDFYMFYKIMLFFDITFRFIGKIHFLNYCQVWSTNLYHCHWNKEFHRYNCLS